MGGKLYEGAFLGRAVMLIVDLKEFKKQQKKDYLNEVEAKLDKFINAFIDEQFKFDFIEIYENYKTMQIEQCKLSWDYIDLRDVVSEAIEKVYGEALYEELKNQHWFDSSIIKKDYILDRCVSFFILGSELAATPDF